MKLRLEKKDKILLSILIFLTFFRIVLAMKLPLFIQGNAMYDDALFIEYANNILRLKWLGDFNFLTYAKGCSFSIFLVLNYILGIPYSLSLILLYIFSITLFIVTIKKIINNRYFLFFTYIYLLFSPVMLHSENIQKVYRGGVITSFALIVISGIIGMYTRILDDKNKMKIYILISSVSLSFFCFLKEDSIWIMPFVIGGLFLTIVRVLKNEKKLICIIKQSFKVLIPLFVLLLSNLTYKTVNYIYYGEFSITDRNGTYFKDVINDLLIIDDKSRNKNYWITRSMLESAYKVSPTLNTIKDEMDKKYDSSWADENGEIHGDIIYWVIKEAVNEEGIYQKGGKEVNKFYKKIHKELQKGFNDGKIKKNEDFYISSVAKGINKSELKEYLKFVKDSKRVLLTHSEYELGLFKADGNANSIANFNEFTMSQFILPDADENMYSLSLYFINISKKIVKFYSTTGIYLYNFFVISFILFFIKIVKNIYVKKIDQELISKFLITLGIFINCIALFIGTTFFCRFLSFRKVYDYSSVIFPLIQIIEMICFYEFFTIIKNLYRKLKN